MRKNGCLAFVCIASVVLAGRPASAEPAESPAAFDVVVYGATPGGIAAAVAAARCGRTVVLAAHEDHIGGIVSNGLTNADIGKQQAVGGLFYEFTRRVVKYYQDFDRNRPDAPNVKLCRNGYWYEAGVAERLFHEMLAGEGDRIQLRLRRVRRTARRPRLHALRRERTAGRLDRRGRPGHSRLLLPLSRHAGPGPLRAGRQAGEFQP